MFWGTSILASLLTFLLKLTYDWSERSKVLASIMIFGFILRFGFGILTTIGLPLWGYDENPQNNGYLFQDAYVRDTQSWELASSDQPIWSAFGDKFFSDQYGGLLAISATIYRLFTPKSHVQLNIILLAASVSILGIPFLWKTFQSNPNVQLIAGLIYTFYPDAIVFSGSQMREPLILGLSSILFYFAANKSMLLKWRIIFALFTSLALFSINAKISIFIISAFLILVLLSQEKESKNLLSNKKTIIGFTILASIIGLIGIRWFLEASKWDAILAVQSSGWLQAIFEQYGTKLRLPFLTIYGVLQPVLPAAIMEPSIIFWKTLGIFRSSGWVLLLPIIIYGLIFAFKNKGHDRIKWLIMWTFVFFWIVLSSLRAGGDLWDNPRYRLTFIIPISHLVANALNYALIHKDHWLWRIYAAEGIYLLFFLEWYISRYTNIIGNLNFPLMVGIIIFVIGIIFGTGIIVDLRKKKIDLTE
jgi:hypothetical protein